jgi:hypothetical protein
MCLILSQAIAKSKLLSFKSIMQFIGNLIFYFPKYSLFLGKLLIGRKYQGTKFHQQGDVNDRGAFKWGILFN